jgi:hypothetical protein
MQTIHFHTARAEHSRLCDIIEEMESRLGTRYDPMLDDLKREAAELHWQICHA